MPFLLLCYCFFAIFQYQRHLIRADMKAPGDLFGVEACAAARTTVIVRFLEGSGGSRVSEGWALAAGCWSAGRDRFRRV